MFFLAYPEPRGQCCAVTSGSGPSALPRWPATNSPPDTPVWRAPLLMTRRVADVGASDALTGARQFLFVFQALDTHAEGYTLRGAF